MTNKVGEPTGVAGRSAPTAAGGGGGWRRRLLALHDSDAGALLILLVLALLAFSPWWAGGRLFAPLDLIGEIYEPWAGGDTDPQIHNHFTSDAVTQYLVYRMIAERSFAEDGRVGWSDLTFAGRSEYANTMALYDDWSMQLHRFLDFWTAWHLGLLGQFLIAGVGMLVFLRSQRISPAVAVVGALAYAANSQFIYFFYHRWHLGAFAWVPWLVWAMCRYRSGRRAAWPLVPLFLALAFLGGNLQTGVFVVLTVVAVWLGWMTTTGEPWATGAPVEPSVASAPTASRKRRLALTGHVAAWGGLGVGLAAFSLYPQVLMILESGADRLGRGSIGYAHGQMQPLLALLLIPAQTFPSLLGSVRSLDLAKALFLELPAVAYFGFLPTLLAYRAVFVRGVPAGARWLVGLGLLIPLTPLVGPLYHRVQLLFIFGGIWAFAWYWEHADRDRVDRVVRWLGMIGAGVVVCWTFASLLTVIFEERLLDLLRGYLVGRIEAGRAGILGGFREWMLARAERLLPELRIWNPRQLVLVAAAGAGFAVVGLRTRRGVTASAVVLLGLLLVELTVFTTGLVTVVDPERHPPYPETTDIRALREIVGDGRVYVVDTPKESIPDARATLEIDPCESECRESAAEQRLFPRNTLAAYGVATLQQYESISLPGIWEAVGFGTDAATLGRVAVTHAVSGPERDLPAGWTPVFRGDRIVVWRNELALPRYLALPEGGEFREELGSEPWPEVRVSGTQNRRRLVVPEGAGLVRVAENWSEGWRYRVDGGEWRKVGLAADRSMLLTLDDGEGERVVEMEYRPRRRVVGWWVSGGALVVILLAAILSGPGFHFPQWP